MWALRWTPGSCLCEGHCTGPFTFLTVRHTTGGHCQVRECVWMPVSSFPSYSVLWQCFTCIFLLIVCNSEVQTWVFKIVWSTFQLCKHCVCVLNYRNAGAAVYGTRSTAQETYFLQQGTPVRNSGSPDPQDSAFSLPRKARQRLLKHGVNLL